ncbi:UNVERIFIED_CONTAM: hypothetical protein HDU68_000126 [Siphonaria sp. JEL0065]|nr:hypothetical protein HDU68_000126 [Siphonaria sp. JEL0065]
MPTHSELNKKKVPKLKAELVGLGLATTGKKEDLVARLATHYASLDSASRSVLSTAAASASSQPAQSQTTSTTSTKPTSASTIKPISLLSEADRQAQRAARFGSIAPISTQDDILKRRAERFGLPLSASPTKSAPFVVASIPLTAEKKFVISSASKHTVVPKVVGLGVDSDTLRKRAERFGIATGISEFVAVPSVAVNGQGKRPASADQNLTEFELKKKQRAERFGTATAVV